MIHPVLFFVFAAVAVAGAINLLAQKHPINSALSLIVVMGALAVLYLLLGAEFVAAIQVIVYAGAVMVLFVFVIMLLNAGEEEHDGAASRVAKIFGYPAVALGGGALIYALATRGAPGMQVEIGRFLGGTRQVGRLLFRDFLLPFEVTSVLILIAIMGAVVLGRRGGEQ
ncbi:MAG TPA: NADH-quinone oxidoreductase subunit J [Terriglobales bacterium]|nr:NADH-quinone oxidoreductase subunit J [Terriglobales bacterium]